MNARGHTALATAGVVAPWLCALLVLGTAVLSPPNGITFGDEVRYLGHGRVMAEGRLVPVVGDPLFSAKYTDAGAPVPRYSVGTPAVLGGLWRLARTSGVAAFGPLMLLAMLAALALDAKRHVASGVAAAVLVLHPTFVLIGRTMMSDLFASVLLLVSILALERRRLWFFGACAGLLLFVRVNVATAAVVAGLVWGVEHVRSLGFPTALRRSLPMAVLPALALVALFFVNFVLYGELTLSGYQAAGVHKPDVAWFSPAHLVTTAPVLLAGLVLIPPGLLPVGAWFAWRTRRRARAAAALFLVALQSLYFFVDRAPSLVETLVVSQRLVLPAIALLLMPYGAALLEVGARWPRARAALIVVCAVLAIASTAAISVKHDRLLSPQRDAREVFAPHVAGRLLAAHWTGVRVATLLSGPSSFRRVFRNTPVDELVVFSDRDPSYRAGRRVRYEPPGTCRTIAESAPFVLADCRTRSSLEKTQ